MLSKEDKSTRRSPRKGQSLRASEKRGRRCLGRAWGHHPVLVPTEADFRHKDTASLINRM